MTSQEQRHAEVAVHCLRSGETCLQQRNYGRAFAHYLLVLKLQPWRKPEIKDSFTLALKEWTEQLEHAGRIHDLFTCYEQACQLFPECEAMLNNMGAQLFRLGYADEAAGCFRKALRLCPDFLAARHNLDNLRGHLVDRWHFSMLNDLRRNQAYQQAIEEAVEQGYDVVLDIGSGTGLLSMFAAQAGAELVYGCEMSKTMYELSRDIVRANQMEEDLQLVHRKSTELKIPADIPARVSLVVTETFDAGLLGEHILTTLSHAWKHLLNNQEGAKALVIPGGASIYVTAVESKSIRRQNRFLYPGLRYLDLGDAQLLCKTSATPHCEELEDSSLAHSPGDASDDPSACDSLSDSSPEGAEEDFEPYTCERLANIPGGYQLLTDTRVAMNINFNDAEMIDSYLHGYQRELTLRVTQSGRLDALAVWFDLHLDEDLTLTSDPKADSCWHQAIFPVHIEGQQYVRCGDELTVQCGCRKDRLQMTCTGITRRRHRTHSETKATGCQTSPSNPKPAVAVKQGFVLSSGADVGSVDYIAPQCESPIQFGDCDFFGMQDPLQYRGVSFLCGSDLVNLSLAPRVATDSSNVATSLTAASSQVIPMQDVPPCDNPNADEPSLVNINPPWPVEPAAQEGDRPKDANPNPNPDPNLPTAANEPTRNGHTLASLPTENGSSSNGDLHSANSGPSTDTDTMQHAQYAHAALPSTAQYLDAPHSDGHDSIDNANLEGEVCQPEPDDSDADVIVQSDIADEPLQQIRGGTIQTGSSHPARQQEAETTYDFSFTSDQAEGSFPLSATCDQPAESLPGRDLQVQLGADRSSKLPHPNPPCVFHLERQEIERLNDLEWSDAYCSAVKAIQAKNAGAFTVLDLTQGASLLPLQLIKMGVAQIEITRGDPSKERLLQQLAGTNGIPEDQVQFAGDSVEQGQRQWNVVLTELVEPCGTLRQQVLEDLALSRVTCLKPAGVIVPSAARVYGLLIESPCLHRDSCLLCDESTLGLRVADHINEFQMMTHVDIDLSSLKYKRLSEPFELFSFDFNEATEGEIPSFLEQTCQQLITACDFGQVTAVVYWFELDLAEGVRLCTLEPTRHWRQAAVMQSCHLEVSTGTEVLVKAACKNSCVDVTVKLY